MTYFLYTLSLISGSYEMIMLMLAFRELLTWRLAVTWVTLVIAFQFIEQLATVVFPHVPLVFIWIVPLTILHTVMSARLLYTKWILTLPIVLFLNALKRLISGISGSILKFIFASKDLMLPRQAIGLHDLTATVNLVGAVVMCLPMVVLIGIFAHHYVVRFATVDFFQHVKIERSDYWLILLSYGFYILAYRYAMEMSVVSQTYVASVASLIFGTITTYLVINKNNRLTDAQLLAEVSQYNTALTRHNQQLSLFKHDYQNILLSLSQYIQNEDMPGLKKYFEEAVWPNSQQVATDPNLVQLRQLSAPEISGLLYAKVEAAFERNLNLKLTILQPVEVPEVNQVSVVRILGNLIDNALDAAAQADQKVYLDVSQLPSQAIQFRISNQLPAHAETDWRKLNQHRFTTKPGHFGYGLGIIQQLTNQQLKVDYQVTATDFVALLTIESAVDK